MPAEEVRELARLPVQAGLANPQQYIQQAYKALQRGEKAEARQLAQETIRLFPNYEGAYLILAALATPQESIGYLIKALEINPTSRRAREGMSWAINKIRNTS